jgi:hypothetical protein
MPNQIAYNDEYRFCADNKESSAGYHIRKLRANALVLCGRRVEYDLETRVTEDTLKTEEWRICPVCNEEYRACA